jgi:hyperosmotically inducible protein
MYCSKSFTVAGLACAMLIGSHAATRSYAAQTTTNRSSVSVDDSTLQTRIENNIKNQPALKNQDIDVKVNNKVVTLSGSVQTSMRKARAERAAHVAGVTSVVNNITIDPQAGKSVADKTGDAAKTAVNKTGDAARTVGSKTKDGLSATGEAITDTWLTTKVHANMMSEPLLKGSDISVDVNNHVVTLKGTVASAAGKARAGQIAKTTEGVTRVINSLVVGPKN